MMFKKKKDDIQICELHIQKYTIWNEEREEVLTDVTIEEICNYLMEKYLNCLNNKYVGKVLESENLEKIALIYQQYQDLCKLKAEYRCEFIKRPEDNQLALMYYGDIDFDYYIDRLKIHLKCFHLQLFYLV